MIYPLKVIQIETTNFCNSHCIFCPHSDMKNFSNMSDSLFKKILVDIKEIPTVDVIVPMLLGEPLCDKKIITRLEIINRILPDKRIVLFTNGSLLDRDKISKLSKIKNLKMVFSLNGATKETRKKLMGLDDFYYVLEMIYLFQATGKPFEVTLVKHPSLTKQELNEFNILPLKHITPIEYKNWSGDKFKGKPQTRCSRAIDYMTIMTDGRVNLCCMDATGKVIFGNVNDASVKNIWESAHRQMYCKAHSEGVYLKGLCSNCTGA